MTRELPISGLVLAGGAGRRMSGQDKGLQPLRGRPLVEWVVERLRPQVAEVIVSANRNAERYATLGARVVPDQLPGFAGPLAGLQAGLAAARHALLATVPCDCPLFPVDLVERLAAALQQSGADVAVAKTGDQFHPVFCLCRRTVLPSVDAFLASGGRKMETWYGALAHVEVAFDDQPDAFANLNTTQALRALELKLKLP